ncbi:MAG: NADP-dependent malic enzyme [Candidatus Pelagibacter bacterium]|nr:NADP-dependent malic enzyme [Candidatus Pelagibacter bacterium]
MKKNKIEHYTDKEALDFHNSKKSGKIEIISSKSLTTKRDLALAYSPGVAAPVKEISKNPDAAYDYTTKGNLVAVISNGSAILGLGNLGAIASKPVMEGKAVLFKRFADIDAIDIEIDSSDPDEIINCIKNISGSFGGINLEDIAAPDCFIIEEKLKKILNIPVFHDDQHGTAIITTAALINALDVAKKDIKKIKVVVNGAGASAIACTELFKGSGVPNESITMLDRKGVIFRGRTEGIDQWKSKHAIDTKDRTLADAIKGADVFLGLSVKDILTKEMVKSMEKNPIIFACANPDPEIMPELVQEARNDVIMATGRSDYPNQVNNLIGFPYIFRGALDVRAKTINEEMKVAAAKAIATLAREDVPDEVVAAMGGERPHYGKEYIIPSTFDPRLFNVIPVAVAKAAIASGVARKKIDDFEVYADQLKQRLEPSVTIMQGINSLIKKTPKRVIFAEGEDESTLKAAIAFKTNRLGIPIIVAKEKRAKERMHEIGLDEDYELEITNSTDKAKREKYTQFLYDRCKREGLLERECDRLIRNDRVIWGACMIACGDADAMVTGNTRRYSETLEKIRSVVDVRSGEILFGLNMMVSKGKTVFIADTTVHEFPSAEQLAAIATSSARIAKLFGFDPKIAFLSHSTFGIPKTQRTKHVRDAVEILENKSVDFKFDGEMQPDVALNKKYKELYPFSEIVGDANVLIMPAIHSAAISTKLMKTLGGAKIIGPFLVGLGSPIEIAPLRSTTNDILNLASVAAYSSIVIDYKKD